jgi:glycine cleavage system H protein
LGDVVYIEAPELGLTVSAQEEAGVVESVKAASDIYAPIGGTVCAVNDALTDAPETVNQDPYGDGWFFKLTPNDPADLDELLDAEGYAEVCDTED